MRKVFITVAAVAKAARFRWLARVAEQKQKARRLN